MGDVRMSEEELAKAHPLVGVTVSAEALAPAILGAEDPESE